MDQRLPCRTAIVFACLALLGLVFLDRPLAEWVHRSGIENLSFFANGTYWLDTLSGKNVSKFLIGGILIMLGAILWRIQRDKILPKILVLSGLVHWSAISTAGMLKYLFGRTRPFDLFVTNDWSHLWFSGGSSFPSGHSAFYFGLFLPLATAYPRPLGRALLLSVPVFIFLARIVESAHFLSDVATSAAIASLYTLGAAWLFAHGPILKKSACIKRH